MWHQYALKHKGACLVFDRTELLEAVDNQIPHEDGDLFTWGKVAYRDQQLTIPLFVPTLADVGVEAALDDLSVRQGAAGHLYLTKNTDWESEQEFRIIVVVRWNIGDDSVDEPIHVASETLFVPLSSAIVSAATSWQCSPTEMVSTLCAAAGATGYPYSRARTSD